MGRLAPCGRQQPPDAVAICRERRKEAGFLELPLAYERLRAGDFLAFLQFLGCFLGCHVSPPGKDSPAGGQSL